MFVDVRMFRILNTWVEFWKRNEIVMRKCGLFYSIMEGRRNPGIKKKKNEEVESEMKI